MNATADAFEPVDFSAVVEGDRLRFLTNDNGYGGRGTYRRTGTVVRVTGKTVKVSCDDGTSGTLRHADWRARSPQRASGAECACTRRFER
ncbi:hypothetical protein [Streptomyces yunnanensis]|uniref:Uncharacterized protein n=1 Tax=Streptomyces yunnanensis TaxID=156453 RepID=A0A9X8QSA1_9ACTN|nr:hypothetical protein [Streptomyces yunnanensis]SHL74047.1 hypothetical protein SAMN05216268_10636 [Streptomyces yunnanensis]